LVTDVTIRLLGSGDLLATFALRVPGPNARATSVPVVVFDPPAWLESLDTEVEVVVVGVTHRRFYRLGTGATGSATEIVGATVARSSETRKVGAALRRATAILDDLVD
jgi:hypothetical protein